MTAATTCTRQGHERTRQRRQVQRLEQLIYDSKQRQRDNGRQGKRSGGGQRSNRRHPRSLSKFDRTSNLICSVIHHRGYAIFIVHRHRPPLTLTARRSGPIFSRHYFVLASGSRVDIAFWPREACTTCRESQNIDLM